MFNRNQIYFTRERDEEWETIHEHHVRNQRDIYMQIDELSRDRDVVSEKITPYCAVSVADLLESIILETPGKNCAQRLLNIYFNNILIIISPD
jgi:hypothetical protein